MGTLCVGPRLSKNGFFQSLTAALWVNRPNKDALPAANGKGAGSGSSATPAPDKPATEPPQPVTIAKNDTKLSKVSEREVKPAPCASSIDGSRRPYNVKRGCSAVGLQLEFILKRQTDDLKAFYSSERKLGQEQFGRTYLCVEKATGKEFACKSILKRKLTTDEDVEDVRREIEIMHHLAGHPNVIKEAYEDAVAVHVVMELCAGGELFDRIIQKGHYTDKKAAALTRLTVGVAEACHSMGVMHRDLKPENFLFVNQTEESPLKTIDFGLSIFFRPATLLQSCCC